MRKLGIPVPNNKWEDGLMLQSQYRILKMKECHEKNTAIVWFKALLFEFDN
jgi:hypothetical protein